MFREAGGRSPRRVCYGRYVHDVVIVNHGVARVRTSVHVVERVEPRALGEAEINQIHDPAGFALRLDDGSQNEIAVERSESPIPAAADCWPARHR